MLSTDAAKMWWHLSLLWFGHCHGLSSSCHGSHLLPTVWCSISFFFIFKVSKHFVSLPQSSVVGLLSWLIFFLPQQPSSSYSRVFHFFYGKLVRKKVELYDTFNFGHSSSSSECLIILCINVHFLLLHLQGF